MLSLFLKKQEILGPSAMRLHCLHTGLNCIFNQQRHELSDGRYEQGAVLQIDTLQSINLLLGDVPMQAQKTTRK